MPPSASSYRCLVRFVRFSFFVVLGVRLPTLEFLRNLTFVLGGSPKPEWLSFGGALFQTRPVPIHPLLQGSGHDVIREEVTEPSLSF